MRWSYLASSPFQSRGWSTAQLAKMVLGVYVRLRHDIPYFIDSGFEFSTLEDRRGGFSGSRFHCCRWVVVAGKEAMVLVLHIYTHSPATLLCGCRHRAVRQNWAEISRQCTKGPSMHMHDTLRGSAMFLSSTEMFG